MILPVDLLNAFHTAKNDRVICSIAVCILALCFAVGLIFSSFSALIILFSYVGGIAVAIALLNYENGVLYFIQKGITLYKQHFSRENLDQHNVCTICSGQGCFRHKKNSRLPWKNIYINKELNSNVENFFQHILDEFILSWYTDYTNDQSFVYELKHSIRYATGVAVKRFLELDIGHIITNKLIPCAMKHVDDHLCMVQIAELKNSEINKIAVDYLGKRLHIAATTRSNELKYLQNLASALTERLLPAENLKCKNFTFLLRELLSGWVLLPLMDVLADPHIINELVILTITYKSKSKSMSHHSAEKVELLSNYGAIQAKDVALAMDLKTIIEDPINLYHFMQYLKKEGVVHLLQFYLNIVDFNSNLLKPDLTKRQLEELHADALTLYKDYLDPKSDNFIGCADDIINELRDLLNEGVYNVAKLQTSEPLYKASEFTFNVLENEWLPLFYHSIEFYLLVGGNKTSSNSTKGAATRQRRLESQGTVAKLSNSLGKIKGALQAKQPVEGSIYPPESRIVESDAAFVEDFSECTNRRNLSTWRISIPAVVPIQFDSKTIYDFNIDVQRTDALSTGEIRHWTVKRRDQDFYTLKSKLIEFHGENEICNSPLPARRSNLSLDARKSKYEEFLKKLLEKPLLKGSDLLYSFLTSKQNFTLLVTTSLPMVDLENIYQSVTSKLRKERGQHLDNFLVTFFNSTSGPKAQKFEWAEIGDEVDSSSLTLFNTLPKTFKNKVFGDNYGAVYQRDVKSSSTSINPNGITDAGFYLLKHIFRVPEPLLKFYVCICRVAQQAVESMCRMLIDRSIKSALDQPTLAFLIKELEEVIFGKLVPTTDEERKLRKEKAAKLLAETVPNFCTVILGKDFRGGLLRLLEILQNPLYNKQLAYSLMDIVIGEMYPELDTSDEFY
ncbi:sorting nexin-14-like isoform X2 [Atheta coriaria]|uniref:sorting nexin-14-like isoform X2 n=1 Tax=Dalotia coriaria TaxID=877792 RepID=UPI0031F3EA03